MTASRTIGPRRGPLLLAVVAIWAIGLVLAPAAALFERSLRSIDPASLEISVELDRLHDDLAATRWDWERTPDAEARADLDRRMRLLAERAGRLAGQETPPRVVHDLSTHARGLAAEARALPRTLGLAVSVAVVATLVAYPLAWFVLGAGRRGFGLLVLLAVPWTLLPVLRAAGWPILVEPTAVPLFGPDALRFAALLEVGLLAALPPTLVALRRLDPGRIEAARDLGAEAWTIHRRIVLPAARPGLAVGAIVAFALAAGSLATPWIATGGHGDDDLARLVWRAVFDAGDWGLAAAHAVVLTLSVLLGAALLARLCGLAPSDLLAPRRTR